MAEWELIAIREQETALTNSLSVDELAWRGLALNNLHFDKGYFRHIESDGDVEIKLNVVSR